MNNVHLRDIDPEVLRLFKTWVEYHQTTMKKAIEDFMREKGNELQIKEKK
jgi:hypothetical protein